MSPSVQSQFNKCDFNNLQTGPSSEKVSLPNELLLRICEWLPPEGVHHLSLVCKGFRLIEKDRTKSLQNEFRWEIKQLAQVLSMDLDFDLQIQRMTLQNTDEIKDEIVKEILGRCTQLMPRSRPLPQSEIVLLKKLFPLIFRQFLNNDQWVEATTIATMIPDKEIRDEFFYQIYRTHFRAGRLDQAVSVIQMSSNEDVIFRSLIEIRIGYCRAKRFDKAVEIAHMMKPFGVFSVSVSLEDICRYLADDHQFKRARSLAETILDEEEKIFIKTYIEAQDSKIME